MSQFLPNSRCRTETLSAIRESLFRSSGGTGHAKTDITLREYRFTPVRRLKGIFQRDQLSMTTADLGLPAEDGTKPPPLKEGEFRLLILTQQQGQTWGCVSAAPGATEFDERVPSLTGPEDQLVAVVETLLRVADTRSRKERAALLLEKLETASGLPAVPLLSSLRLRSEAAAADARTLPALAKLIRDRSLPVRLAALEVLRDVLSSGVKIADVQVLTITAEALHARLGVGANENITHLRVMVLEAMGYLLALKADLPGVQEVLIEKWNNAPTHAERTAAVTALARSGDPQATSVVLEALAKLPLDEPTAHETILARAAVKLDRAGAEKQLILRLSQSLNARQSLDAEVEALGEMRSKEALPLLLRAAASAPAVDRARIAWALGRLGDDSAVPVLAGWMRGQEYHTKESSLTALETLGSAAAAREIRPLLKTEGHLPDKLRIARLLARHEIADGYALATEHLADVGYTPADTLVLAALKDARTNKDLNAILLAKPDRRWHAAALAGLAATGDAPAKAQLLAILNDDRHPLAADAALAAGTAGDADLLPPLALLVKSRNRAIAVSALTAVRWYLKDVRSAPRGLLTEETSKTLEVPAKTRDALAAAVATLVLDAYVDADVRQDALATAKLLKGDGYPKLLADLADQAELEGTRLLATAEEDLRTTRGNGKWR